MKKRDFNTLLTLAQQNDPEAQLDLAYCYAEGNGVEKKLPRLFIGGHAWQRPNLMKMSEIIRIIHLYPERASVLSEENKSLRRFYEI